MSQESGLNKANTPVGCWRKLAFVFAIFAVIQPSARAAYTGSVTLAVANTPIQSAGTEILGNGGGTGVFVYKGGGNAVDAAVATALAACVITPASCSLGGYGGHMMIWKSGWDGDPQKVTCIDFNSTAGSLSSSNMFAGNLNPVDGSWTGPTPAADLYGWKAAGVPGTFAGLYLAQTNYGRKVSGTNYFSFAEIMRPILSRVASGQAASNNYYTLSSVSNLLMDLYTNSDPRAVFYEGDIAQGIAAAMQANGGLVTYADMTNYRPREVTPFSHHFNCPNGTPATVYVAPPGSAGVSVLEQLATIEALGWTNGPNGTWDNLHYWHSRAEAIRLMWKDHFQWIGDPWSGILPPDILGNGNTNFCDQLLAHATKGYSFVCPSDPTEVQLTNSLAGTISQSVNGATNQTILTHWNDIRYGTFNICACDQWGNCVAVTLSMGGTYGAQVGVPNLGLVFGQGIALFEPRPGWPNSIAPGKRPLDNMAPTIVIPDFPVSPTNGLIGGRPPFAIGAVGGSTIENNIAMHLIKYLMDGPSSSVGIPNAVMSNFEANNKIYMPSYPSGVQSYLNSVGYSTPGSPPSAGSLCSIQAWIPPVITTQPIGTNVNSGATVNFSVTATGLPLFYQWYRNGTALTDGGGISGSGTPQLTLTSVTNGGGFSVVVSNGGASLTSSSAGLTIAGAAVIATQPSSTTNAAGSLATFSVVPAGNTPFFYQWLKNGVSLTDAGNISGTASSQLSVSSAALADQGIYSVIVANLAGTVTSVGATLSVTNPASYLSQLWSVGPSAGQPWMNLSSSTSVPNQRTIAYNALSNHLYVISRSSNTTSNYVIYVLNATNGAFLYTLKTNGIQSGVGKNGIGLVGIAVADDGAIYAANESNDAEAAGGTDAISLFRVYRWADANSNTAPVQIFAGDPSGATTPLRWGDNLAVRGTGTNTQVLLDMTYFNSFTTTTGTNGLAAILSPTNISMTNFTARWFATTNYVSTVGRSLQFDLTNNAIWEKGATLSLYKNGFNPASISGNQIASSNILVAANFSSALMGVGLDLTRNLAAGVFANTSSADSLNLYDITDLNSPRLVSQVDFPTNPRTVNNNYIGQTFFKDDLLFSIDANNGIMVLRIIDPGLPIISTQPASRINTPGTPAIFSITASGPGSLSYRWLKDSLPLADGANISGSATSQLTINSAASADAGTYLAVVGNAAGNVTSLGATLTLTSPWVLYEPFNYSNIGGSVSANTPANWTFGGTGSDDLNVAPGNLVYPGLAASIGNSVTNGGNGLGVRRLLGTNISAGKIYFSALFRINDLGFGAWNGQGSIVGALTAPDNTGFRLQVVVKSNSPTGYVIGTQKSGTGGTTSFDSTERHAGDTIFLVGKYDFTVAPNTITLWINPSSSTFGAVSEPVTGFVTATNGQDGFTIDRFNMRQNTNSGPSSVPASMQWDELRFAFSWADTTPLAGPFKLSNLVETTGGFQFGYANNDGRSYRVFASTNLVDWNSIGTPTQTSPGQYQFIDQEATNLPHRFYQLRSP